MTEVRITKAEVYKAPDGWRWRTVAGNGEIIAQGEAYRQRVDCLAALRASIHDDVPIVEVDE